MNTRTWVKAAASNNASQCVEICVAEDGSVQVADTKQHGEGPVLTYTKAEWDAFLEGLRTGEWVPSRP
jgi:hypothetical protein